MTSLTSTPERVTAALRAAQSGPIGMATLCSRGEYQPAAHHLLLEREVLRTIADGGRLIVSVSVRSGKTELLSRWTPAWFLGRFPGKRVILGSHAADFAATHGRAARDRLTEWGPALFGTVVREDSHAANRWDTTADGGMFTVGVGGSPIGRGADLMVIDDPIKSFEEAMSQQHRDRVKDWWTGTLRSRLEPGGAVVVIASRWHEDDLSGWLLDEFPDEWREVRLPALADDEHDPLGRAIGDPLWPEKGWTVDELERVKREVTARFGDIVWQAQYQQRSVRKDGDAFKANQWLFVDRDDVPDTIQLVRGWDLAATHDGGDWTVGVLLGVDRRSERVYVVDVQRGQWSSDEVKRRLGQTAMMDGKRVPVYVPQDPGQAGKAQAADIKRELAGFRVIAEPQTGSKEMRAWGLATRQKAGNVALVRAPWNEAFRSECEAFPTGRHDDQVDAAASAYNVAASAGTLRA